MESTVQEIDKIKYFMPFLLLLFQMKFSCFYFFYSPLVLNLVQVFLFIMPHSLLVKPQVTVKVFTTK